MTPLQISTLSMAVAAFIQSVPLSAGEPSNHAVFSKHIHDAIMAGFRKEDASSPTAPVESVVTVVPPEVDSEMITLPALQVTTNRGSGRINQADLQLKTEAIPLTLGTGVTEFKGRKFTILTRRILFIPVAFKIAW